MVKMKNFGQFAAKIFNQFLYPIEQNLKGVLDIMIILNPNKNNFSDELKGLYDSSPFEWQCEFCHEIH